MKHRAVPPATHQPGRGQEVLTAGYTSLFIGGTGGWRAGGAGGAGEAGGAVGVGGVLGRAVEAF